MKRVIAASLLLLAGCYESSPVHRDAAPDRPDAELLPDAGPPPPPTDQIDLLFVIENYGNVGEEQASVARELPRLLSALATGDVDGDGGVDMRPFTSIQLGVVTTDMGTGGHELPTCLEPFFGDDGILRSEGQVAISGCLPTYPRVLTWQAGEPLEEVSSELACVAVAGTEGCGFEQHLEAALKASSPSVATSWTAADYVPPVFFRDTRGHADGQNAGLIRHDSILAIFIMAEEDDSSASDPEIFDVESTTYTEDLSLRRYYHPDAFHTVERYASGLLQLRRHPSRLAFFVLGGIPVEIEPAAGDPVDWPILISPDPDVRDPRMLERIDETMPNRLIPSCNVPDRGLAFPPVRMLRVAEQLEARGARVGVGSICQASYASPVEAFITTLAR